MQPKALQFPKWLFILMVMLLALMTVPFFLPTTSADTDPSVLVDAAGRFVSVDGLKTYLVEDGDADAPPIVFIHGLFGSSFTWRKNLEAISDAGFRAIAYDRIGAGLSDKPAAADYSHAAAAHHLAKLLDTLNISKAVIVGHSAGGNVLAHFALRYPERVDRLIVVDGAIIGPSGPPPFVGALVRFPPISQWARVLLNALLTQERLQASVGAFYANTDWVTQADLDGYWRAFQTKGWDVGLLGVTRDAGSNRLSEAQLEALAQFGPRTLIIWGERDTVIAPANGQELLQKMAGAAWVSLPGVGHQPMEEAPNAFNTAVISFLKRPTE
ncbi:MAG: alpha/beta hydrolase [Anaerolineae bacterium]